MEEQAQEEGKQESKETASERMRKYWAEKKAKKKADVEEALAIPLSEVVAETPIVNVKTADGIKWFGEVDLNPKTGKPSADYPGWYFDKRCEEMQDDIRSLESAIDLDLYRGSKKKEAQIRLDAMKKRYDSIVSSRPNLSGKDKDRVAKVAQDLGDRIAATMPNYSDMQRGATGRVDIEEEARRMVFPCIEVKTPEEADYFKQRGIPLVKGKVSRNDAIGAWKTMSKCLEADSCDAEILRNQR